MTRPFARALVLGLTALLPAAAFAAQPAAATKATFHVAAKFKHNMHFAHAMASATLHYTKGDVSIKITADNLPSASTLGKHVYVAFAIDRGMSDKIGTLTSHGAMSGTSGMVMMNKVQDINIYAEGSAKVVHPGNGVLVLSSMVG